MTTLERLEREYAEAYKARNLSFWASESFNAWPRIRDVLRAVDRWIDDEFEAQAVVDAWRKLEEEGGE